MGRPSAFFTVDPISAQNENTGLSVTPRKLLFPKASISSDSPHVQLKHLPVYKDTSENFKYFTDHSPHPRTPFAGALCNWYSATQGTAVPVGRDPVTLIHCMDIAFINTEGLNTSKYYKWNHQQKIQCDFNSNNTYFDWGGGIPASDVKFKIQRELPTLRCLLLFSTITHLLTIPAIFFTFFFLKSLWD